MSHPEHGPRPAHYTTFLAAYERAWRRFWEEPTPHHHELLLVGEELLIGELRRPGKFDLGQTLATPGAVEAMARADHIAPEFLLRHKHGDWGELCAEDRRENERALRQGSRLLSAYRTRDDAKLWVITEWDRSATTMLLPEEY
jgi:hypothetical protein